MACTMMHFLSLALIVSHSSAGHSVPVVGILSEPITTIDNETEYMIAASYVKWLEVSGARSIPIPYDATPMQVDDIFSQIDGVLFPGGGGKSLPIAARRIWQLANEVNAREGGSLPIWGICLGFEYLLMLASENDDILEGGFDAENISLPLHLYPRESSRSTLYAGIEDTVQTHNITLNNHAFGISPRRFGRNSKLTSMFRVTSFNRDRQGRYFVSTIESKNPKAFPYYGVQYHPEKNAFEYATYPGTDIPYEAIDHSPEGLMLTTHLGHFFAQLMRQSREARIVNPVSYPPVYSYDRKVGIKFQEFYIIPSAADIAKQGLLAA
ncbi:gamma-glutamyl-peptidase [Fragilaria crotonensis]|nr:gamma-glutamyl-peptidase [Fragilaria crotonensis]